MELRIEKLNANDMEYIFLGTLIENGVLVDKDDVLATVETSKASVDILAPKRGVFVSNVQAGQRIKAGMVWATIT